MYKSTQNIHFVVKIQNSWFWNLKACTFLSYRIRIVSPRPVSITYRYGCWPYRPSHNSALTCRNTSEWQDLLQPPPSQLWRPCGYTTPVSPAAHVTRSRRVVLERMAINRVNLKLLLWVLVLIYLYINIVHNVCVCVDVTLHSVPFFMYLNMFAPKQPSFISLLRLPQCV